MNAAQKQERASIIHDHMVGNPLFPNPSPSMAEFGAAIVELKEANVLALDRGRLALLRRDRADELITSMITRLAGYVNSICLGDALKIASAGFEMAKRPEPISQLNAPRSAGARPGVAAHQLILRWAPVPGAVIYMLEEATGGTFEAPEWTTLQFTSDHRVLLNGRDKSQPSTFRVHAMGRRTKSPVIMFSYQMAA